MNYLAYAARLAEIRGASFVAAAVCENALVRQLRDAGGAYAVKKFVADGRSLVLLSGRDSQLSRSIAEMRRMPDVLADAADAEAQQAVVQAASQYRGRSTVGMFGLTGATAYGVEYRRSLKEPPSGWWEGLLNTTSTELTSVADELVGVLSEDRLCVLAS